MADIPGTGVSIPTIPIGGSTGSGSRIPSWASALGGASALGVALLDDPVGFVQAVIVEWFVTGALSLTGELATLVYAVFGTFIGAFVDLGVALGLPFRELAAMGTAAVGAVRELLWTIALETGPFAPFVMVAMGAVLTIGLAIVARAAWETFKVVTWK